MPPDVEMESCESESHRVEEVKSRDQLSGEMVKTDDLRQLFQPLINELHGYIDRLVKGEQLDSPVMSSSIDDALEWIRSIRKVIKLFVESLQIDYGVQGPRQFKCEMELIDKVCKLLAFLKLTTSSAVVGARWHSNICCALGDFAEDVAGEKSIALLTSDILEYLVNRLGDEEPVENHYYAVSALERFAQTEENKVRITERLRSVDALHKMARWATEEADNKRRQVGFMTQWALDNVFATADRVFSYETTNTEGINAMIDYQASTTQLKIAPDGLEARNDVKGQFESARCTFSVKTGVWCYEVEIVSDGLMQIGWATKSSKLEENSESEGVGDDKHSIAYDGVNKLIWYKAESKEVTVDRWKPGDILGCLLDFDTSEVIFYLNGVPIITDDYVQIEFFKHRSGFYPAASLGFRQQCRFNFGQRPFRFPPVDKKFQCINDVATLTSDQRTILPLGKKRAMLIPRENSVSSTVTCFVCTERAALVLLMPCQHDGYCCECALKLYECPLCRAAILQRVLQQNAKAVSPAPRERGRGGYYGRRPPRRGRSRDSRSRSP